MLRYYDKTGFLKPVFTDSESKYRYYSMSQLALMSTAIHLKYFNLSKKEIEEFLKTNNLNKVIDIYDYKIEDINEQINQLKMIKSKILVKKIGKRNVLYFRKTLPVNFKSGIYMFNQLHKLLEKYRFIAKNLITLFIHL